MKMVDKSSKLMDKFVTNSGGGGGGCGGPGSGSASAAGNATSSSSASATAAGFGAGGIGGGSNMTTSNGQKPVPMKLFAAWEVDRTPPNCIPRWVQAKKREIEMYICMYMVCICTKQKLSVCVCVGEWVPTSVHYFQICMYRYHYAFFPLCICKFIRLPVFVRFVLFVIARFCCCLAVFLSIFSNHNKHYTTTVHR